MSRIEMSSVVTNLVQLVLVLVCLWLVVSAHATVGWASLGLMLLGMVGLLVILYFYNRRHR